MGDWYVYSRDFSESGGYPHGIVKNSTVHKGLSGDGTTYEHWAVNQTVGMIPGSVEWGTGWINDNTNGCHDWNVSDLNSWMQDWDPNGNDSGSQSFTATLSAVGPTIAWTYSQPNVSRADYTTTDKYKLAWNYTDSSAGNSINYDIGSQCRTYFPTSPGTYDICFPWAYGRFYDNQWWDVDKAEYYANNWFQVTY